ncbi:MAG: hypothetical protein KAK01_10200 [Candidatus Marinimicrobia bacterium]|nr:hypothetical protein [Candidatus Neomarinimicrobiota bacterium]
MKGKDRMAGFRKLMFCRLLISGFVTTHLSLMAQTDLFGYYEVETDFAQMPSQQIFYGYNKFRLDISSYPGETISLNANLNIQQFFGQREWNLFDYLPASIWEPVFGSGAEYPFTVRDTLYLDNVYARLGFDEFDVTVGKQQLSLGTGYAWNPSDVFNTKDLMDPTYEQTGVPALRVEIPIFDRLMFDLIMAPDYSIEKSTYYFQYKLGIGRFDLTGFSGILEEARTALNLDTDSLEYEVILNQRKMIGGSLVGQIWEIGMWTEGCWNLMNVDENFTEYVVGLDHTFDFRTYLMMEYFHNGRGVADKEDLTFNDYVGYLGGGAHSIMQDYLFVLANHPLTDFVSLGLYTIGNLNDNSYAIAPLLEWSVFENVSMTFQGGYFLGDDDTEFGSQDWSARIRMRIYF